MQSSGFGSPPVEKRSIRRTRSVYQAVAEEVLETADRRAYSDGVRILKKAAKSARAAGRAEDFAKHIAGLRERYRRRPTLIAMLDKAGFV